MKRSSSRICVSIATLLLAACGERGTAESIATIGDAERGRIALTQYACHACHMIPGITGSKVYVGPSLQGLATRPTIAGDIPNTPGNLVRWIRGPQAIDAQTAMPDMGVSERDARDMTAYLARLR
jgi:cytochrome c2